MSESNQQMAQFKEFMEKFQEVLVSSTISCLITEKDAETILTYPVKEITAWIPKASVTKEMLPYMDNKFCRCFIVGAAFPTLEGWEIIAHPETRYVAYGFGNYGTRFKIEQVKEGESQWVEVFGEPIYTEDTMYMVGVEFMEDLASQLSSIFNRSSSGPLS